ncbi:hypothetical protein PRIPAC_72259 [Pristionchus pacificus]|uniref:VWA domain-containing protein n=1 Tax=Pristionchus pacificus TaxID=54126 RepID=A0A2A6B4J2_PRIPA|nr:hypothetical protein PRIPAC_72259 [Pristionchus pacificus]|eukprot:PDM60781.1 VWA domain-containing protein [Pristionchus pacificus]
MGRTQHVVFASLVVAVFFLIVGAIMLTLGIIKFNEAPPCAACSLSAKTHPDGHEEPAGTVVCVVDVSQFCIPSQISTWCARATNTNAESALFSSSHVPDVQWKNELENTQSPEYRKLAKLLENKINKAIEEGRKKRKRRESFTSLMNEMARKGKRDTPTTPTGFRKPRVIVNKIEKNEEGGVNVYLTMIFPDGIKDQQQLEDVVKSLKEGGVNSNLFGDPLAQCEGQPKAPPGQDSQTGELITTPYPMTTVSQSYSTVCFTVSPEGWPVTTPSTGEGGEKVTPGTGLPEGVTCDVGSRQVATIFLIDVAHPTVGTLEEKLANISSILSILPFSVHLPVDGSAWPDGVTFQIVTFVGDKAQSLGEPCTDSSCWMNLVAQLTPANVNPNNAPGHTLANGMEFVLRNIAPVIPPNQARSLIVILDSIDASKDALVAQLADTLKHQHYFVISALQIGIADSVKARLQLAISDGTHYYMIPSIDWINNPTVVAQIDHWICDARLPTPQPTAPTSPTPPGLITTEPPPTEIPPTPWPERKRAHACALDVLFLVDESQSMLDYGYHISMDMVRSLTDYYSDNHNSSRFALVTFNSALVFSTHRFMPKTTFAESLNSVREQTGATYFELGFDAARSIVKGATSRATKDDVRTVIVFMSDGANGNGTVEKVVGIARDLRTTYQTQIIAIGLNATQDGQRLTKEVIGFGTIDSAVQSSYFNMKSVEERPQGVSEAVQYAGRTVHCKGEDVCGVDLTFVIEVSESELAENVDVQKAAVASTINHFRQSFGPFKARVSLVFFSAPQGLQLSEYERSGVLYSQLDDAAVAINATMKRHFILGGASDVKLAMETTRKLLDENDSGNDQMVIFMARGEFRDGQAINCCDDPSDASAAVRAKATIQGVVIGGFPNKPLLDKFTGSNSIDGNALVSVNNAGKRIAAELIPIIEEKERNAQCAVVPAFVLPCQEIVDLVIAMHASTPESFNTTKYFVSRELLPDIFGGRFSSLPQSEHPLNIALIVYSTLGATTIVRFNDAVGQEQLAEKVERLVFPGAGKSRSSQAFVETKRVLQRARVGASSVLLMISDDIDLADVPKAADFKRKELADLSYTFGVFVARDRAQRDQIKQLVDHGILLSTIDQLNLKARRSARNYANQIARAVCKYVGPQILNTTPSTFRRMANPPEKREKRSDVRPREIWPDVIILVDTAVNNTHEEEGMSGRRMDKIKHFLKTDFLPKFVVDAKHSRFAVASFDRELRLHCKFTDIASFSDVEKCLDRRLAMPDRTSEERDWERSLKKLESVLLDDLSSGFRPLKKTILLVLTDHSNPSALFSISRRGLRPVVLKSAQIEGVKRMTEETSEMIVRGITESSPQSLSRMVASDVYLIVDGPVRSEDQEMVRSFLHELLAQFNTDDLDVQVTIVNSGQRRSAESEALHETLDLLELGAVKENHEESILSTVRELHREFPQRPSYAVVVATGKDPVELQKALGSLGARPFTVHLVPDAVQSSGYRFDTSLDWGKGEFHRLVADLEKAHDSYLRSSPRLADLAADIVVVLDVSAGGLNLATDALLNLTSSLTLSKGATQLAFLPYSDRPHEDQSFLLSHDVEKIRAKLHALPQMKGAGRVARPLEALTHVSQSILHPMRGWRQGPTYVVLISTAKEIDVSDPVAANAAELLRENAHVMIATNYESTAKVLRPFGSYHVHLPKLSLHSGEFRAVTTAMLKDYITSLTHNAIGVTADYVFVANEGSGLKEERERAAKVASTLIAHDSSSRLAWIVKGGENTPATGSLPRLQKYADATAFTRSIADGAGKKPTEELVINASRPLIVLSSGVEKELHLAELGIPRPHEIIQIPKEHLANNQSNRSRDPSSQTLNLIERIERYKRAWKSTIA